MTNKIDNNLRTIIDDLNRIATKMQYEGYDRNNAIDDIEKVIGYIYAIILRLKK